MMNSLRTKLSLSYIIAAVIIVFLINILTNLFVVKHFKEYVNENQQLRNKEIVATLAAQYKGNGKWNLDSVASIGESYLVNGIIIKVVDAKGSILWDAKEHNNGMCQKIIEHMAANASGASETKASQYSAVPYSLYSSLNKVGMVEIGPYLPDYLNEHDKAFIEAFNGVLMGVGVFSLIFALLLGTIMSRRLSSPISRVISAAGSISKGFYNERIAQSTNITEIIELTSTVNNLAESLEQQEALRKRLTGDVAHELRTPLATLQSHMEAMIDGIWTADAERLRSCHEEIVRISKLVGDLEKLTKYENEKLVMEKTDFDVGELAKRLLQNFESQFLGKDIRLEFTETEAIIYADRDKISQVLVNLFSNALKFTAAGGRVSVLVLREQGCVKIVVEDNGVGIPGEDLPYIFERFYRADKSRNRLTGGSGIGLTISRAIINAHEGSIDVESIPDRGTKFTVILPESFTQG
ncbi:signal transduction histidine-protein kinase BaeS [Ruminiclostridium hungatei]|uniref:histidine kinase n=1 Tax=Ruminiclostridium hungatei TaxID=48256 RepID=A0A1V4SIF1_RUMHU|nr:ATP-binding protein [Ruminiclostridium hungatei]OPX43682.1 signal transduction histidine-protein kinase BaeS [Ruminiclostridium hungatei]